MLNQKDRKTERNDSGSGQRPGPIGLGHVKDLGFYMQHNMKPGRLRTRSNHELPRLAKWFPSAWPSCSQLRPSLCFNKAFNRFLLFIENGL